jgi:hypothetical protein
MKNNNFITVIIFLIISALLTFYVSQNIFFWDTVLLSSKYAHWYYETNFSELLLPLELDTGHPTGFAIYLALIWKIFGKSLEISHWAMFPLIMGIVLQVNRLCRYFISEKWQIWVIVLILCDTTLLAQSCLISPDLSIVFFFLLGVNSILNNKKLILSFACVGLCIVSMRGMMVAVSVLLFDVFCNYYDKNRNKSLIKSLLKLSLPYFPTLFIGGGYLLYHYFTRGWIGWQENSQWSSGYETVNLKGILYNSGLLGWRLIDFGHLFVWLGFITIILISIKKTEWLKSTFKLFKTRQLIALLLSLIIIFFPTMIIFSHVMGHRYLLSIYVIFSLFVAFIIIKSNIYEYLKKIIFIVMIFGMLSGNFWIYPEKISQGWDSTLAHLPYYELRNQMLIYLEENNIDIEDVGCAFPNLSERKYLELNENLQKHQELNLDSNKYILYSNIYNDFTDDEIEKLNIDFVLVKEFKKMGVFMRLYKNE